MFEISKQFNDTWYFVDRWWTGTSCATSWSKKKTIVAKTLSGPTFQVDDAENVFTTTSTREKTWTCTDWTLSWRSRFFFFYYLPDIIYPRNEKIFFFYQLFEKPQESEVATQTDYLQERPSTPPFCPGKVGVDAETQIDPGDVSIITTKD